MKLLRRCKHENTQTVTNIFGDANNHFRGRRFVNCINCGKEILKPDLDFKCHKSNQFYTKLFYLRSHDGIRGVSDGDNTFNQLYRQITILFSVLCNSNKENSCKSWVTHDNEFKSGSFIVGIKLNEIWHSMYIDKLDWEMFQVEWVPTFPESVLLGNYSFEDFQKVISRPSISVGDVFEKAVYRRIVVQIEGNKYKIRTCYPDSLEHHDVDASWFNDAKFIEHIELK